MSSPENNLFSRLHKWASRQDENFLTESFAYLLEQLLALAPAVGVRLVKQLTDSFIDLSPEDANKIKIQTQVTVDQNRPDLKIWAGCRLVWVEVKVEAGLGCNQLERYRTLRLDWGIEQFRVVLLTRYPIDLQPEDAQKYCQSVRWFQVAHWLEDLSDEPTSVSDVARFLIRQFHGFLEARGMALAQVGKELPEGLRALTNLMKMLHEAATACKASPITKGARWDRFGFDLNNKKYWVGVNFSTPDKLSFVTNGQIDREAAAKLTQWELAEAYWVPGGCRLWRGVELDSEQVHFFSRSKVSQMEWLEGFLRECLAQARSIEKADQPPILDEPEESM